MTSSIKVANYKSFGDEPQGFEEIRMFNVMVGRNNNGKSALLDVIAECCKEVIEFRNQDSPPGKRAKIYATAEIDADTAKRLFPNHISGDGPRKAGDSMAAEYAGKQIQFMSYNGTRKSQRECVAVSFPTAQLYENNKAHKDRETNLARMVSHSLEGKKFVRLLPERDVTPEPSSNNVNALSSGKHVTTMIQNIYNKSEYDRALVTKTLLNDVNEVVMPDYEFAEIAPRQVDGENWEIHLREKIGDLIPLSSSGSGLKTILCVIVLLTITPILQGHSRSNTIFALEELEGHMHPALLRRLLTYIGRRIRQDKSILFVTTHSNVVIDHFAGEPEAQIVHVTKNASGESVCSAVTRYLEHRDVLDALDCRASDLLQSNGIIWVEGPSDRTYLNRWIELFSNGTLREGTHYQCAFYGGKLLSHLEASEPTTEEKHFLSILRVNRNAAVLIDSDRTTKKLSINATKQRICDELSSSRGYCWITKGREIENYLPLKAIAAAADILLTTHLKPLDDIGKYLEHHSKGAGKRFEKRKAAFAVKAAGYTELKDIADVLDWSEQMTELCSRVRTWNRIAATE